MKKSELLARIEALEAEQLTQRRNIAFLTERIRRVEDAKYVGTGPQLVPVIGPWNWPVSPKDFVVTCAASLAE